MSAIRKSDELERFQAEKRFDGPGIVKMTKLIRGDEDLYGKGRLFNEVTLEKNCGIGFHIHQGDGELYYMLSGEAEYEDTDHSVVTIKAGDVTITYPGEGHAITNIKDEPARFIALILYE